MLRVQGSALPAWQQTLGPGCPQSGSSMPCRERELASGKRHLGSLAQCSWSRCKERNGIRYPEDAWCLGPCPWGAWLWASRSSCPLPCKVLAAGGTMILFPPRALLLCRAVLLFFSSHIYCTGELLRQVQLARLFQDDKDFVDMPLKSNPGECPPLQRSPLPSASRPAFITAQPLGETDLNVESGCMQRKGCWPCWCYAQPELASQVLQLQSTGFLGLKCANASLAPLHPSTLE